MKEMTDIHALMNEMQHGHAERHFISGCVSDCLYRTEPATAALGPLKVHQIALSCPWSSKCGRLPYTASSEVSAHEVERTVTRGNGVVGSKLSSGADIGRGLSTESTCA